MERKETDSSVNICVCVCPSTFLYSSTLLFMIRLLIDSQVKCILQVGSVMETGRTPQQLDLLSFMVVSVLV